METIPFVRCVGIGTGVYQENEKKAYDWRLICILQAEGTLLLEGQFLQTLPGDLFLIRPGTAYRVCSGKEQSIAVINFDTTSEYSHITEPVLSVDAVSFQPESCLASKQIPLFPGNIFRIATGELELFSELYRLYLREDILTAQKNFLLSAGLLHILSKVLAPAEKPRSAADDVYGYVLENACQKLTVEQVAKRFNYSCSYVEKLLRRNYQTSFRQLMIDTRLKKALWLLENTSDSCEQIAFQLGFCSSQHFSQTFRKRYGRSPRQYK